jgi:hypothetical protein
MTELIIVQLPGLTPNRAMRSLERFATDLPAEFAQNASSVWRERLDDPHIRQAIARRR